MIRIGQIQEAMLHLVGWEQSYDPQQQIDEALTETESGLTFQQAHPMVTLENIKAIMPEEFMYHYPEWDDEKEYSRDDKVRYKGKVYISVSDDVNVGNEPDEVSSMWKEYDFMSLWLTRLTNSAIAKTVQTFLQQKSLLRESQPVRRCRTYQQHLREWPASGGHGDSPSLFDGRNNEAGAYRPADDGSDGKGGALHLP